MRVALGHGSRSAKLCLLMFVDQETEKGGEIGPGYKIRAPLPSKLFLQLSLTFQKFITSLNSTDTRAASIHSQELPHGGHFLFRPEQGVTANLTPRGMLT